MLSCGLMEEAKWVEGDPGKVVDGPDHVDTGCTPSALTSLCCHERELIEQREGGALPLSLYLSLHLLFRVCSLCVCASVRTIEGRETTTTAHSLLHTPIGNIFSTSSTFAGILREITHNLSLRA